MHPFEALSLDSQLIVVALIATKQRHAALERALSSVGLQTRAPDIVIVVDDGPAGEHDATRACLDAARLPRSQRVLLLNRRTAGAAGAWNSGLDEAARHHPDADRVFVAILDDDDTWSPDHIACCLAAVEGHDLTMVAAGIVRYDDAHPEGRPQQLPERLAAEDAFAGNPHIQGSNLFVSLRDLLEAGLFDEALRSTTDRDLVVRLADLGTVRFGTVSAHTVHHDARSGRPRLSTPGSAAKQDGLRAFWRKYRLRMSAGASTAFRERAARLFGCIDLDVAPPVPPTEAVDLPGGEPLALVVGVIADADAPGARRVAGLLRDLLALQQSPDICGLDVIMLENGADLAERPLHELVQQLRAEGLRVWLASLERQSIDADAGVFGAGFQRPPGRAGIGRARTMLQRYVALIARPRHAVAWILDDDKRLDPLTLDAEGRLVRTAYPWIGALRGLRATGADVVLGLDTDAPPLPAASAMRTQMVDLHATLAAMMVRSPGEAWPDRSAENHALARAVPDYYYDLARGQTSHLETPCWFVSSPGATTREALLDLCARAPRILAGEQVFRPLFVEAGAALAPEPSALRGGNTFVFDIGALLDVPNCVPDVDGREMRRSDMIWALLNSATRGRRVVRAVVPVRHDRADVPVGGIDVERFADDIRGYALFRALSDLVKRRDQGGQDTLDFMPDEIAFARHRYEKYIRERAAAFTLSFHRVRGLAGAVLNLVSRTDAWWLADPAARVATDGLVTFARHLLTEYAPERLSLLQGKLGESRPEHVVGFLGGLADRVAAHRIAPPLPAPTWLEEERAELARVRIERSCGVRPDRLLGLGSEGVVWTDGDRVYKVFDYWKDPKARPFFRSLVGRWSGTDALYPLDALHEEGPHGVLVYAYEASVPYEGGHAAALVQLLRECRAHGIACRNIHPSNLRVTATGVRLVDYGSDIRTLTDVEWRHMVRRTWLTWRWPMHPELKTLMRRALTEEIPELDGWERLLAATESPSKEELLDGRVIELVRDARPLRVIDYGCGVGRIAQALARSGAEVLAYDPCAQRSWQDADGLAFTTDRDRALAAGPFDAVVCTLVLCTLDEDTYRSALADLRALALTGSRVVIAVCNPFFTCGGDTPLQSREVPAGAHADTSFVWHKVVASTSRRRRDVHRPLEHLRRDLLRAGLNVESVEMTPAVDLARLEAASDFLILVARAARPSHSVSLLIKACALESDTLEGQVRHVVGQLEGPSAFCERVLLLDPREAGFARQWTTPKLPAARAAADRLVAEGILDRVVEGPSATGEVAALTGRWFGVASEATHTAEGAPVAPALAGFEACSGEYVLQVDADVMIARLDREHDPVRETVDVLRGDPRGLTAALNICHAARVPWTFTGPDGPWRVEVRAALFDRARLLASRPWPNEHRPDGSLAQSWHRALDVRLQRGDMRSYRGGDHRAFFVHPPNQRKEERDEWLAVVDRIEAGVIPEAQRERVEWNGDLDAWLGPPRTEPLVVLASGRDVPPGRFLRWLEAMKKQTWTAWGAVVIDDGGSRATQEFLRWALAPLRDRVTLLTLRDRRGGLANCVWTLRHICKEPTSVVALVDADDALLGAGALARVMREYDRGADLTVGSMLRTDKWASYQADLVDPRGHRGGNVWQHLRTFRRSLFEGVPDEVLRLNGQYVDLAWDWALMLPLVELAQAPAYIAEPLYLYEPSGDGKHGAERELRERVIHAIVAKPSLRRGRP